MRVPMSEDEFFALPENIRAEWVDGEAIIMSPSSADHAQISVWLASILGEFVAAKDLGAVYGIEFAARLRKGRIRVPDVFFIAKSRLQLVTKTHLKGAPDLAIEVISPDSISRDYREKFADYERAGVREYWIIHPAERRVELYALAKDGQYKPVAKVTDQFYSKVLGGFFLDPQWLWKTPLPRLIPTLAKLGITR